MGARPTLAAFVAELRAIGLPVSVAEHADAMAAVAASPVTDRTGLKSALAATLVKSGDHYRAFELVFDIFFADKRVGSGDPAGLAAGGDSGSGGARGGAGADGDGDGDGSVITTLSDDELTDLLYQAAAAGDRLLLRAVLAEAVTRYGEMEPGRAVAGVYYLYKTLRRLDLDRLLERLVESDRPDTLPEPERALAADRRQAQVAEVRAETEAEIRRRLIADRGAEAVAGTLRAPLPEDVDLLSASPEQLAAIRQAVAVLGRKLAARLGRKRRHNRRSSLDFRRTIRASLANGGVPADLYFTKPRPTKPEIMLIVDVSSSVAPFAAFTLQLAYTIRSQFSQVRSFAFTDGIEEITGILEEAEDVASAARHINGQQGFVALDGHSDYGMALKSFWDRWGAQIKPKTSVIILGDGRNNYHASRSWVLDSIRRRARRLYWLNPEPVRNWDTGDSIVTEYGQHCDQMVECRNLRQLKEFAETLD